MKNMFKFASLLAAAVMLFACEKIEKDFFQLNVDKTILCADGEQSINFEVIYDEVDVTSEVMIHYMNEFENCEIDILPSPKFSTKEEGLYKFWTEYKGVSDTISVMATSDGKPWQLSFQIKNDVIQADGKDFAEFSVLLGDKYNVTSESVFRNEKHEEVDLNDYKFTTREVGEYQFYAEYGTLTTYNKDDKEGKGMLLVKAISVAVPSVVDDPQVSNTSFVHRAFLTQYTGTGCGYCPAMIKIIRELFADKTIPEKAVHAAVHSFNSADPAYISAPKVNNYPYLTVDQISGFSHAQPSSALKSMVESSIASTAKAGISVSPKYYEDEGVLVVTVAVKAATDGLFNVGAWLLEDEIYGMQEDYNNIGDKSYNTHENCVRIADSKYKGTWFGHALGNVKTGDTVTKTFVMNVKKSWKVENLHLAVFTSYGEQDGDKLLYSVCNAVDAPIDAPTPFEYK